MKSTRAVAPALLLVYLAIAGLLTWGATKTIPAFNQDSQNAKKGEQTTTALIGAGNNVGAAQTASAQVIGEAASDMADSPARDFIINEVPIMLARGPAPDPKQIIAARDRKIAFLQGNLAAQRELTQTALKDAGNLRTVLAQTTAAKQAADEKITIAAAEKIAANRTSIGLGLFAAIAVIGFLYVKFTGFGLKDIALMANRAHDGQSAFEVLDGVIPDHLHDKVRELAAKIRAKAASVKAAAEAKLATLSK